MPAELPFSVWGLVIKALHRQVLASFSRDEQRADDDRAQLTSPEQFRHPVVQVYGNSIVIQDARAFYALQAVSSKPG